MIGERRPRGRAVSIRTILQPWIDDTHNFQKALCHLDESAASGNSYAMNLLQIMLVEAAADKRKIGQVVQFVNRSVDQGNANGQSYDGLILDSELGVHRDNAMDIQYFEKAATQGTSQRQYHCGLRLVRGVRGDSAP
jgi:TPR repeat protein